MKFLLKNTKSGEETLCDKITIEGFDYYVSDEKPVLNKHFYRLSQIHLCDEALYKLGCFGQLVIATNNPNIEIAKVVDEIADGKEIKELAKFSFYEETRIEDFNSLNGKKHLLGFVKGYNKAQETHSFSEEDMIDFLKFSKLHFMHYGASEEEILKLWKEQKPKIVYYE